MKKAAPEPIPVDKRARDDELPVGLKNVG